VHAARRPARRRALGLAALIIAGAGGLAACSTQADGQALAQQACTHVMRSVHDWVNSTKPGVSSATAASLQSKASTQLRLALPLAAEATSDDGTWNSLMTTISEDATIDETHLVPALEGQCALADTEVNVNPQAPSSNSGSSNSPPTANVNPQSPSGG
jgi:hypothetical protein